MREEDRKGKGGRGGRRGEGDAVSQLQLLDPPVVIMGLFRTISKKNVNFKIAIFS